MLGSQIRRHEREFQKLPRTTLKELKKLSIKLNDSLPFVCKYGKDVTADIIVAIDRILRREVRS